MPRLPVEDGADLVLFVCGGSVASIEGAVSRDESGTDKDALSSDPSADAGAGVSKLTDGAEELDGGAAELLDGIDELDGGVVELLGGTDELDEEAAELLGGTDAELDMELFKEELDELVILSVCGAEEELALDATELFELSERLLTDCAGVLLLWLSLSTPLIPSMSLDGAEQAQTKRQHSTRILHSIQLIVDGLFFILLTHFPYRLYKTLLKRIGSPLAPSPGPPKVWDGINAYPKPFARSKSPDGHPLLGLLKLSFAHHRMDV